MFLTENILLLSSILVFVAILVTKVGVKLGAPSLLLFLLVGLLAGSEGLGLQFDDYELSETIGHMAMTVILFTGGFQTKLSETKPILKRGIMLSTIGVLLTMLLTGTFVYFTTGKMIGGFAQSFVACLLIGATVSSTDSASVFSVLEGKRLKLRDNIGPLLELESGSNDPMAYALVAVFVKILSTPEHMESSGWIMYPTMIGVVLYQLAMGAAVGFGVGHLAKWGLGKIKIGNTALFGILVMSTGFFASGVTSLLSGNDLLAIYITAVIVSNKADIPERKQVTNFFDGVTWIMELAMFMMLGLLASPKNMMGVALPAILTGLFLIFVARPVSVFLTLLPERKVSFKSKLLVSWVGLKGAGPILFATAPVVAQLEGAESLFNVVFFIALISLLLQGMTLVPMAKWLNLTFPEDPEVETFGMDIPEVMGMLRDHTVSASDIENAKTLRELRLPHGIRVVMVKRQDRFLVPHGSMALEEGDHLLIIMGESDD